MKKLILIIIKVILAMFILITVFTAYYWYNNRLFLWEARILWNQQTFTDAEFKSGTMEKRAKMVVDLIKSKRFIGVDPNQISHLLGEETGDYYHNDSILTYKL